MSTSVLRPSTSFHAPQEAFSFSSDSAGAADTPPFSVSSRDSSPCHTIYFLFAPHLTRVHQVSKQKIRQTRRLNLAGVSGQVWLLCGLCASGLPHGLGRDVPRANGIGHQRQPNGRQSCREHWGSFPPVTGHDSPLRNPQPQPVCVELNKSESLTS